MVLQHPHEPIATGAPEAKLRQGIAPQGAPEVRFSVDLRDMLFNILPEKQRKEAKAQPLPGLEEMVIVRNPVSAYLYGPLEERLRIDMAIMDLREEIRKACSWLTAEAMPPGVGALSVWEAINKLRKGEPEDKAFTDSVNRPLADARLVVGGRDVSLHEMIRETVGKIAAADEGVWKKHQIGPELSTGLHSAYAIPGQPGKIVEVNARELVQEEATPEKAATGGQYIPIGNPPAIFVNVGSGKGIWMEEGRAEVEKDVVAHEYGHFIGNRFAPIDDLRTEMVAESINLLRKWEEGFTMEQLVEHYSALGKHVRHGLSRELYEVMGRIVEKSESKEHAVELLQLAIFGEDSQGYKMYDSRNAIGEFLEGKRKLVLPGEKQEPKTGAEGETEPGKLDVLRSRFHLLKSRACRLFGIEGGEE